MSCDSLECQGFLFGNYLCRFDIHIFDKKKILLLFIDFSASPLLNQIIWEHKFIRINTTTHDKDVWDD